MAASERAIRAGKAAIELFLDDEGLKRQINQTRRRLQSMGQTLLSVGSQLTVVGGAVAGPFALALSSASDLQETMSKFEAVFGSQSAAVKAWADDFAQSVGRSKQEIASFLAGTQDLLVPIGIDPQAAAQLSKQVAQLAVDLGSFNNVADGDALRDLQAALTGESEPMKKYGVIVNETAVKQQLLNKGLDDMKATEADKAIARLEIIMRGTVAAQGDAIRTSGSFANQMKALKAVMIDTAAAIGQAILPAVSKVVGLFRDAIKPVAEWAQENQSLVASIAIGGAALTAFGLTITTVGAGVSVLATAFAAMGAVVGAIGAPLAIAGAALVGIVGTVTVASVAISDWRQILEDLGATAGVAFSLIEDALKDGNFEAAATIAALGIKVAFLEAFKEIAKGFADLAIEITGKLSMGSAFTKGFEQFAKLGAGSEIDKAFESQIGPAKETLAALKKAQELKDAIDSTNGPGGAAPSPPPVDSEEVIKARREMKQLKDEADKVRESLKTPDDLFKDAEEKLRKMRDAGLISPEEFARAFEAERKKLTEQADAVRDSLRTPEQQFDARRKELETFGAKGFLSREEVNAAIEKARKEMLQDGPITARRSDPVFADQVRFGLGAQEIPKQQLNELTRIRRGIDEQNRKKAARIGA